MIFYHGTNIENWKLIQEEGVLFGRHFFNGKEDVMRRTCLAIDIEEARCYGPVILVVEYDPFKHKENNTYTDDCYEFRVFKPITIDNVNLLEINDNYVEYADMYRVINNKYHIPKFEIIKFKTLLCDKIYNFIYKNFNKIKKNKYKFIFKNSDKCLFSYKDKDDLLQKVKNEPEHAIYCFYKIMREYMDKDYTIDFIISDKFEDRDPFKTIYSIDKYRFNLLPLWYPKTFEQTLRIIILNEYDKYRR